MTDRELLEKAGEVSRRAYVPYSRFPVGAALECVDGAVYLGCNIENASSGATICAERVAMSKAISEGHTEFKRIAVYGKGETYCLPCGICRQFMNEFAPDIEVLCTRADGRYVSYKLTELLPHAFVLK